MLTYIGSNALDAGVFVDELIMSQHWGPVLILFCSQEEMKVSRLTTWLLTEDEFCAEEERLLECIEVLRASKVRDAGSVAC